MISENTLKKLNTFAIITILLSLLGNCGLGAQISYSKQWCGNCQDHIKRPLSKNTQVLKLKMTYCLILFTNLDVSTSQSKKCYILSELVVIFF